MTNVLKIANQQARRNLPDGWRWVRLGDICDVETGGTPDTGRQEYYGGNIRWLKSGDIRGTRIFDVPNRITELALSNSNAKVHPPGSVVLAMSGQGKTRGTSAILMVESACSQSVAAILPSSNVLPDLINFALVLLYGKVRRLTGDNERTGLNLKIVRNIEIPLPPLSEQKRIAAILNEQMAAVERARAAAEVQLEAAKALPAASLRAVFSSPEAKQWPKSRIGDIAELLPSKSIATDGDTTVQAITTACLTESGFQPSGVKVAKMWARDASECIVSSGEVLIARSNTPELVGRVAMFQGTPGGSVASDLTIRLWPNDQISGPFLTAYLSFLYLSGYWKERAGGASGSMKKITRTQIQDELVPIPPFSDQQRMAARLSEQMADAERTRQALEAQLATINALPAALLRRAFNGEL